MFAQELVYQDTKGVIRWKDTKEEVALFGANYCLPSACDYRAAGYVDGDRKEMIREDMDHFRRMGWQGLRVCFWGDWQNSDAEGNLIDNDHLDLMDYLIAEASKRNIYMLFSPIVTYDSQWPEMNDNTNQGFEKTYPKHTLIHDEKAIQCQENYMKNILNHVNRYTGRMIKDEPHILFVELINEPAQFPDDITGMIKYINRMCKAIKSTGCKKLTYYNLSQNFKVSSAIQKSKVDGASYAWYPQALNNGYTFMDNGLHFVARYEAMVNDGLKGKSRIVYEFDAPDTENGYMYPAMVREYRRGGIQFAAMFSYDMHRTASRNLGWQTHFFNMVYTPSKAVSGMIAAEVMKRIPRGSDFGLYPENNKFGEFRVDYNEDLGILNSDEKFYYSNHTSDKPKDMNKLKHIAGVGSSIVVDYEGTGIYFLDKIEDSKWVLEIYPDIMKVDDPFKKPNPHRICRQAVCLQRNIRINLPDLKISMNVTPGKYVFYNHTLLNKEELPLQKYYSKESTKDWVVVNKAPKEMVAGSIGHFECEVYGPFLPDSVFLYIKDNSWYSKCYKMKYGGGFKYTTDVDLSVFGKGVKAYHIGIIQSTDKLTFPDATRCLPNEWDYYEQDTYQLKIVGQERSLVLLDETDDWTKIRRTRCHNSPQTIFSSVVLEEDLKKAFKLVTPDLEKKNHYISPCDVTFSHYIYPRMSERFKNGSSPKSIIIEAQGVKNTDKLIVNFVDTEGRAYGNVVNVNAEMNIIEIPVSALVPTKAVILPQDWPGVNEYWYAASTRMNDGVAIDWKRISFLQISLRDEIYASDDLKDKGVIVKSVSLKF